MSDTRSSPERSRTVATWLRTHRGAALTLAAVVTVSSPYWAASVTWLAWASLLGAAAVLVTAHAADDRILTRVVAASFLLRCGLALSLFAVSSQGFPLMPSLHRDYGLWEFGIDGVGFHEYAVQIVDAVRHGTALPPIPEVLPFALPIAAVYWLLGASPLHFILVNAWLGALSGLLAYLLACRIGAGRNAALAAAAAIAFWPSSLIWSTQLLRDTVAVALILSVLLLLASIWQTYSGRLATSRRAFAGMWRWGALAAAVFALAALRSHVGVALAVAAAAVFLPALVQASFGWCWRPAIAAGAMAGVTAVATLAATSIDMVALASPFHPEAAYVRLAERFEQEGRPNIASHAYRRAIELNPNYLIAHRGLILALLDAREYDRLEGDFARYLQIETDATEREALARRMPSPAERQKASSTVPPLAQTVPALTPPAATGSGRLPKRVTDAWVSTVERIQQTFADRVIQVRQAQLAVAVGLPVDTTAFDSWWMVIFYLPRALVLAFLAPFPWDLMSTIGSTGPLRPVGMIEILLIALLVPSILMGGWRALRTLRPESLVVLLFTACAALGYGLIVSNGGTLFRVRLQFLFPALILASTALPRFAYRWIDALTSAGRALPSGVVRT